MLNKIESNIISLGISLILAGIIIIVAFIINTDRIECTSSEGNITIYYKKNNLRHYKIDESLNFDINNMYKEIDQIGLTSYLKDFSKWFEENKTNGKCTFH